ncbi:MAG: class A beta-lactamase [Chryseolinea sp.]
MQPLRRIYKIIAVIIAFVIPRTSIHAQDSLKTKIDEATFTITGDVGVSLLVLETKEMLSYHGDHPFPMQSIYKFPLAMAVLQQVDAGKISLTQKIHITKADYFITRSPLMEKYPDANIDLTVNELIEYTITQSDNVTCDLLFRLIGGPKKVDLFVQSLGIRNIAIINTEKEMHAVWKAQYNNWSTPPAMAQLFQIFYEKEILSKQSKALLLNHLINTKLGFARIRASLPDGTILAHRPGTGGENEQGVTSAVNDAGIITLPNGKHLVIVVYILDTKSRIDEAEEVIANITKVVYEHYSK